MKTEEALLDFIMSTRYSHLPGEVVITVKRQIMNTFAAMLCGSAASGTKELAELVRSWGGKGESTVFLQTFKAPVHDAVLVNATMARALDFDDFHMQTGMHASATVVPTALAIAEATGGINGESFITAIALGGETLCRMRLVPDHCIGISGWTGEIYGAFGAVVTAGKLCGLSREKMRDALGLAYSQAAGSSQTIYDGAMATRLQQGFSARAGCVSTAMASAGLTGARNFLEGKAGLYPVYYRGLGYDIGRLTEGMGKKYEIMNIATKPYPCCGFTMAPIENIIQIMAKNQIESIDIERIEVYVNQKMYNTVCLPIDRKYQPQTPADAMFSLPYVVATAALHRDVVLEDFATDLISEPRRIEYAKKIKTVVDHEIDKEATASNIPLGLHRIDVYTGDGKKYSNLLRYATGFPEKPMTPEECFLKAKKCASFALKSSDTKRIEMVKTLVDKLEEEKNLSVLIELIHSFVR